MTPKAINRFRVLVDIELLLLLDDDEGEVVALACPAGAAANAVAKVGSPLRILIMLLLMQLDSTYICANCESLIGSGHCVITPLKVIFSV